jgi:hypothetical protein
MADNIEIKIVLDDGQIKTGFLSLEKQAKKTGDQFTNELGGAAGAISSKIKGIGVALAAAFTVTKLVGFLKESAKEAANAERATNQLSVALANIGAYSVGAAESFQRFADGLQRTTGVSDDLIKQNAALLVSIGGLSGQGLERATKAALNLAQGLQIDVATAFDLVSKAAIGNTTALGRNGFKISEHIPKAQKLEAVLLAVETRFKGLAETRLNTFEGSLTNLSNAFGEIQKSIGKFIVNSPAIRETVNFIAKEFFGLSETLDKFRENSSDPFKNILLGALQVGRAINEYVVKPIELGFNLIRTGVLTVYAAIQGLIALFVNFGHIIAKYLIEPIVKGFGFIGEKIVGLFNAEVAAKLKTNVDEFGALMGGSLETLADSTASVFSDSFDAVSKSADETFNSKIGSSLDGYIAKLTGVVEKSKSLNNEIANGVKPIADKWADGIAQIKNAFDQGLVKSVAGGMQKIGENLASGKGAFDNFGQTLLGIFGDLAIQIGTILIGMGIGIENLKLSLASWNATGLIVAGAALVALGGALKAISGKPMDASAAAGGGIAAAPSSSTELTPDQNLTRQEPQTNVEVVINGSIYDSDETGSRIVDLINTAFDKKGVVINQGAVA